MKGIQFSTVNVSSPKNRERFSGLALKLWIKGMALLFLVYCIPALNAMDWPSLEGNLIHNFGWNDGGQALLGTSFETEGPVLAAEKGEIFFTDTNRKKASRLPSPLGVWTAVDHGDGLVSIYSRLDGAKPIREAGSVEKGSYLAEAGTTGWSAQKGFYFSLFDRKERRWVNPAMIVNRLPDTSPPFIRSVGLRNQEGRLIELDSTQARTVSQGRYTVLADVVDTLMPAGKYPLAPYLIGCLVNGSEIGLLNFETYSARDGVLMVYRNGLVPVKQVYAPYPRFEIGNVSLTRGQVNLQISAQDINENRREEQFRLIVE
ncbi:MAG: M23 family metallopeptidase [Treponema sp.]|jgi:hypothetical protein|nr:M23 family metallopeptidase [Treponema sp.]